MTQNTEQAVATRADGTIPRIQFAVMDYSPNVTHDAIRTAVARSGLPKNAKATAARVAATSAAVKQLGLPAGISSTEIMRRRTAQHSKIAAAEARRAELQDRVDAAQRDVDTIPPGAGALAASTLRLHLATEKRTLNAVDTTLNNLVAGLKSIDPVAHHTMQTSRAASAHKAKSEALQTAVASATAQREAYIAANAAVSTSPGYRKDLKAMNTAISKAQAKLDTLAGTPFDYAAKKESIEEAYQKAVLEGTTVSPKTAAEFSTRASEHAKTGSMAVDFIAAYNKGTHSMDGSATLLPDGTTWDISWTADDGTHKNTQIATAAGETQQVFQLFESIGMAATLRSRGTGQSTHAAKALTLAQRTSGLSGLTLKTIAAIGGEDFALQILDFASMMKIKQASRNTIYTTLDDILKANGTESNLAHDMRLIHAEYTGQRTALGTKDTPTHHGAAVRMQDMMKNLSAAAKPHMDNYAHAIAAGTRTAFLSKTPDANTGLARTKTSGFSFKDPTTGRLVPDPTGKEFLKRITEILPASDIAQMQSVVRTLSDMGIEVSRMEARANIITEDELIRRVVEHNAENYYLPLQDADSTAVLRSTKGRQSTATGSPIARMLINMDARIGIVSTRRAQQMLYDTLKSHPIPDFATLNTQVEVADGLGNAEWVAADPFNKKSIRLLDTEGRRVSMTFADTRLGAQGAEALTRKNIPEWLHTASLVNRAYTAMLTTYSPCFFVLAVGMDMLTLPFNMEQATEKMFSPAKSLKLGAKAALMTVPYVARAAATSVLADLDTPLFRQMKADGAFIQMAMRNQHSQTVDMLNVNTGFTAANSGLGKLRYVKSAVNKVEDVLHSGDMGARMAFLAVTTTALFGRKIKTEEDVQLFKAKFPKEYDILVLGSKNSTLSFEEQGSSPYLRSMLPFFGTAMNSLMRSFPRSVATTSGKVYLAALVGASYVAAMAGSAGGETDEDGKKKFYRQHNAGDAIQVGGVNIIVPPEMRPFAAMGMAMAAVQEGEWTPGEASVHVANAMVSSFSPVRVSSSPNTGDQILAAAPWGFLLQPIITQNDAFGRPLANAYPRDSEGNVIDNPEDWEKAYPSSSDWSKGTAKVVHSKTGIDISPGSYEQMVRTITGGLYGMVKNANNPDITATQTLFSRFIPKNDDFAMGRAYSDLEAKYNQLSRSQLAQGDIMSPASKVSAGFAETNKYIEQVNRSIGKLQAARIKAITAGNTIEATGYDDQITALRKNQNIARGNLLKQVYDIEGEK